jgi:starch-binding outer membrane protein SusE/F
MQSIMKMRKIIKNIFLPLGLVILMASCEKQESRIFLEAGTPPVLTSSVSNNIPLSFANKDQEAIKLSWTNPNYKFTTGVSSHNVTYQVEIDTTGSNFTNPARKIISVSNDLSLSLTHDQLNDYMLNQLQLSTTKSHNLEIRVRSTLANGSAPLFSNVLKFTARPYAIPPKVTPPASGRLFIVGSATPGGWNNPVPANQEFTKMSDTFFEITLPLNGGGSYLFLPVNGSWDAKYGAMGANNTNDPNSDDFKPQGGDMIAPGASGTYKIQVDFQRGKFTLTKM